MKKIHLILLAGILLMVSCLYPGEDWGFEVAVELSLNEKTCERLVLEGSYQILKGSVEIEESGYFYSSTKSDPDLNNAEKKTATLSGTGFTATIEGLTPNTTYYVRPYVRSDKSYAYGEVETFRTDATTAYTPALSNAGTSAVGAQRATVTSVVQLPNDSYPITEAGFCYSDTTELPSLNDSYVQVEPVDGSISYTFASLKPDQKYYVRAYAINALGTFYGSSMEFSTASPVSLGEIEVSNLSSTGFSVTASLQTPYISEGFTLVESGFCYSGETSLPTVSHLTINSTVSNEQMSATVSFGGKISFFIRAYAKCSIGEYYYSEAVKVGDKSFTVQGISFDMVAVNGGSFSMGATDEQLRSAGAGEMKSAPSFDSRKTISFETQLASITQDHPPTLRSVSDNEKPVHTVSLSPYYIGKHEVTQQLWQAVMGYNNSGYDNSVQNPVENISWYECLVFIDRLKALTGAAFVLPTEAQWEYAARGGALHEAYKYAGSELCDTVAWTKENSSGTPHVVGSRQANALGIYDMSGNIAEKCYDWYAPDYYSNSHQTDPSGPAVGTHRVQRGGDYYNEADWARVSSRSWIHADSCYLNHGFRLALREGMTLPEVDKVVVGEMTVSGNTSLPVKASFRVTVNSRGSGQVSEKGICISSSESPNLAGTHYHLDTIADTYEIDLYMKGDRSFYVRSYAISEAGVVYGEQVAFTTPVFTFTDSRDGNEYIYIGIGSQIWMAENLKYLPTVVGAESGSTTTPYYYVYGYNGTNVSEAKATDNYQTYGVLYNWPAAMAGMAGSNSNPSGVQGVCPAGWHLPSHAEWTELIDYLGGESVAGGKLKESGTNHWSSPNEGASNETGFTALPGGYRFTGGTFLSIGGYGYWWYATDYEYNVNNAWYQYLYYNNSGVQKGSYYKEMGFSVRCVKGDSPSPSIPILTTCSIVSITHTTAKSGGNISSDGLSMVLDRGVCWSTAPNPTIDDNKTSDGTGTGEFTSSLTNLNPGTTYYLRAYATNSVGTAYGEEVSFTTTSLSENSFIDSRDDNVYQYVSIGSQVWMAENLKYLPSVVGPGIESTTTPCYYVYGYDGTNVSEAKATSNYQTYGVIYNWSAAMVGCPTGWHLPSDAEWTELTDYLGGTSGAGGKLKETGTSHWNSPNEGATNETGFTALPGGIRNGGGIFLSVGDYGYWWCATESLTGSAWRRRTGSGYGDVGRGGELKELGFSVRCLKGDAPSTYIPTLTTDTVVFITQTTAEGGGNISSDGGAMVLERGVCWSTNPSPTIADNKTSDGTGTGAFTSILTNLSPGTTYYLRAYATNSVGTAYGMEVSFETTELQTPTLTTSSVVSITQTSVKSGGNISSDGGAMVSDRGVCWSTDPNPTIDDNKTSDGTGIGEFTSTLTNLSPGTTYYLRAYATNSVGTAYGEAVSFTTTALSENFFTDSRDGNVYQYVTIGSQVWMAENLRYLPDVVGPGTGSETTAYYYVYDYDGTNVTDAKATANYSTYGVLYNWPAAMAGSAGSAANPSGVQGVCPAGWHLPSETEWTQLANNLGGHTVAGGRLKEAGTTHWKSPNTGASNEGGFTALPGGNRTNNGRFYYSGYHGCWWSATEVFTYAYYQGLDYDRGDGYTTYWAKWGGCSVRCIKDAPNKIESISYLPISGNISISNLTLFDSNVTTVSISDYGTNFDGFNTFETQNGLYGIWHIFRSMGVVSGKLKFNQNSETWESSTDTDVSTVYAPSSNQFINFFEWNNSLYEIGCSATSGTLYSKVYDINTSSWVSFSPSMDGVSRFQSRPSVFIDASNILHGVFTYRSGEVYPQGIGHFYFDPAASPCWQRTESWDHEYISTLQTGIEGKWLFFWTEGTTYYFDEYDPVSNTIVNKLVLTIDDANGGNHNISVGTLFKQNNEIYLSFAYTPSGNFQTNGSIVSLGILKIAELAKND